MSRLGARVLLHTNAALPIWFFRNRIRLRGPRELAPTLDCGISEGRDAAQKKGPHRPENHTNRASGRREGHRGTTRVPGTGPADHDPPETQKKAKGQQKEGLKTV